MTDRKPPPEFARAREQFLAEVSGLRADLHRYCARLVGSTIDGEDVVQDVLAKAFYALSQASELPPLRPWLFRIAHNTAIDFLRSHDRSRVDLPGELDEVIDPGDLTAIDPFAVESSLGVFMALPIRQRSAVILKDVLDHSLEDAADTMGSTVAAVKSALVRGRAALRVSRLPPPTAARISADERCRLGRYVELFNARDWDGLRDLLADECELNLVSRTRAGGRAARDYFSQYAKVHDVRLAVGSVEGRPAVLAFVAEQDRPAYFILLAWQGERLASIRDFRYAPYAVRDAELAAEA